jgi:hypothetical protein
MQKGHILESHIHLFSPSETFQEALHIKSYVAGYEEIWVIGTLQREEHRSEGE